MNHNLTRSSAMLIVSFINIVTPLSGLIMELVFAWTYGTSIFLDAFRISSLVILLGTQFFSVYLLPHVIIPIYTNYQSNNKEEEGWYLMLTIGLIISSFLIILILFANIDTSTIVNYLGPGLDQYEGVSSATILVHFFSPVLLLMVWCGIFSAILNVHKKYLLTSAIQVIPNLTIIIFILFFYKYFNSAYVVGVAVFLSYLIMTTVLFFNLFNLFNKNNFFIFSKFYLPDMLEIKNFFKRAIPLILLIIISQLGIIEINKNLSLLGSGIISNFWFSWKLLALVSIVPTGITYIFFPEISRLISEKKNIDIFNLIKKTFQMTVFLTFPICFFLIVMSHDLVFILFRHGEMDYENVKVIALAFAFLLVGTPASAISLALSKAAIVYKDNFTIIGISSISSIIMVFLVSKISESFGIYGICIFVSVLAWICFFIQLYYQSMRYKIISFSNSLIYLFKIFLLTFVCGFPVVLIELYLDINLYIKFSLCLFIFFILVMLFSLFFKVNEFYQLMNNLKNLIKR